MQILTKSWGMQSVMCALYVLHPAYV